MRKAPTRNADEGWRGAVVRWLASGGVAVGLAPLEVSGVLVGGPGVGGALLGGGALEVRGQGVGAEGDEEGEGEESAEGEAGHRSQAAPMHG